MTFGYDPHVVAWTEAALAPARVSVRDPALAHWLHCGGTWFVGVDALPNDEHGAVEGGPPLSGDAVNFIRSRIGLDLPWHRAQVSVCYPGYPRQSAEETLAAFQYRVKRDAAHVDGLLAEGPQRRRYLREPHAFILGLPLAGCSPDAAPLVVWEGSHKIMREAFSAAYAGIPLDDWRGIDVTEIYQAARRRVFANCRRIELPGKPGEACLLHRHVLHGVAPWGEHATAGDDGRMVAYFRPEFKTISDWLDSD